MTYAYTKFSLFSCFAGASYMVITAHFIDDQWQLKKLITGFKYVMDHKG